MPVEVVGTLSGLDHDGLVEHEYEDLVAEGLVLEVDVTVVEVLHLAVCSAFQALTGWVVA